MLVGFTAISVNYAEILDFKLAKSLPSDSIGRGSSPLPRLFHFPSFHPAIYLGELGTASVLHLFSGCGLFTDPATTGTVLVTGHTAQERQTGGWRR